MYQYSNEKDLLLLAHKKVTKYLKATQKNPLLVDLREIHKIINDGDNLYNIYITDRDLVIRNSTYTKDMGFDLSFAKASFDEHFEKKTIGICTPLFEKSSKQFLSYTDSYLVADDEKKLGILQVSYSYESSTKNLKNLQKLIAKYPSIVDAKAFIIIDSGFINDIILKDFISYKPDLKEILSRMQEGKRVNDTLISEAVKKNTFTKNSISYTELYLAAQSPIFDNTKIIYSILLNNSELQKNLKNLNVFMFLVVLLGLIAMYITFRLRKKEIKFSEQDKFVQSSMHEIKTPLSIITLNNELRELEFGRDEYSQEIDSAIKTLKTSYEDMSFTITKEELSYPLETLCLEEIIKERVVYFESIAISKHKTVVLTTNSTCKVKISKVELIRFIDNNLSNAIKYSEVDSVITIVLNNNRLSFHNRGAVIENKKNIFKKYVRENRIVGGHGLGLSIVQDIAKCYDIEIELISTVAKGTKFLYGFKCHTSDM